MDDKHRDTRSVFGIEPKLIDLVLIWIDVRLYAVPLGCFPIEAYLINRSRNGVGDEAKETLIAVPVAAQARDRAQGRRLHICDAPAVEVVNRERGDSVFQILNKESAANDAIILDDTVCRLGNNFYPVSTLRAGAGNFKNPVARRVFIGVEVNVAIIDNSIIKKIFIAGDGYEFAVGIGQVFHQQFILGRAFRNMDQEPPAIFRYGNIGPMLWIECFAKDQGIFPSILVAEAAELVKENFP